MISKLPMSDAADGTQSSDSVVNGMVAAICQPPHHNGRGSFLFAFLCILSVSIIMGPCMDDRNH